MQLRNFKNLNNTAVFGLSIMQHMHCNFKHFKLFKGDEINYTDDDEMMMNMSLVSIDCVTDLIFSIS